MHPLERKFKRIFLFLQALLMATWTLHLEGGPKRVNHAAVCIDGFIYSFGGFCTGDDFSIRQDIDVHQFDMSM